MRARPSSRAWIALATVALLVVSVGGAGAGAYYAGITRGTLQSIFGGGAASVPPVDGHYNILLLGGLVAIRSLISFFLERELSHLDQEGKS